MSVNQVAWSQEAEDEALEEMVITDTHFNGIVFEDNLPVTTRSKDDLLAIGAGSTEDLLAVIPWAGDIEVGSDEGHTSSNRVRDDVASFNNSLHFCEAGAR